MRKFIEGWTTAPPFHLPITVDTSQRIGKPGEEDSDTAPTQVTAATAIADETPLTQVDTIDTVVDKGAEDKENLTH